MVNRSKFGSALVGMSLFVLLAAGLWLGGAYTINRWHALDRTVATVTAVGIATLLLSARIVAGGIKALVPVQLEACNALYPELLEALLPTEESAPTRQDHRPLERRLALYGSANVIHQFLICRSALQANRGVQNEVNELVRLMRRDLRRSNVALKTDDINALLGRDALDSWIPVDGGAGRPVHIPPVLQAASLRNSRHG